MARSTAVQPLVSLEVITVINLANVDNLNGVNVTVRGLPQTGIEMRKNVHIASGRWFNPARREVVVGKSVAKRFPSAGLGGKVHFGRGDWDIVGVMDAGAQYVEPLQNTTTSRPATRFPSSTREFSWR